MGENHFINIYLYFLKRKHLSNKYIFEIKFKTLMIYQFLAFGMIDN